MSFESYHNNSTVMASPPNGNFPNWGTNLSDIEQTILNRVSESFVRHVQVYMERVTELENTIKTYGEQIEKLMPAYALNESRAWFEKGRVLVIRSEKITQKWLCVTPNFTWEDIIKFSDICPDNKKIICDIEIVAVEEFKINAHAWHLLNSVFSNSNVVYDPSSTGIDAESLVDKIKFNKSYYAPQIISTMKRTLKQIISVVSGRSLLINEAVHLLPPVNSSVVIDTHLEDIN